MGDRARAATLRWYQLRAALTVAVALGTIGCDWMNRRLAPRLARAPQADFSWLPEECPCEDLVIRFDAAVSRDEDGHVRSYTWDFGDGDSSDKNEPQPIHQYPKPGRYFVHLLVADNDNLTSEVTKDVDVF
jgi:PKD repeat protein